MKEPLRDLFDAWARTAPPTYTDQQWLLSKWDVIEGIQWPQEKVDRLIASLAERLALSRTDRLADLGCGGGWMLKAMASRVGGCLGVDYSTAMIQRARSMSPDIPWVVGALGRLPLTDECVDKVLCYFVILNICEEEWLAKTLDDMIRILKPGGRALIGQIPDKARSSLYDRARARYWERCRSLFSLGKNTADECWIPKRLFDREEFIGLLKARGVRFQLMDSFNPFYLSGEPEFVPWRFDAVVLKD